MTYPGSDAVASNRRPVLGVVLLDCSHYVPTGRVHEPDEERAWGCLPTGWFESPATWPVPTRYTVAAGASPQAIVDGDPVARAGVEDAVRDLATDCALVTTDCGFSWRVRTSEHAMPGTTLLSGLDLLDLAGAMTQRPVGVLTFNAGQARRMLADHPLWHRLRLVGLDREPVWRAFNDPDFAERMGWSSDPVGTSAHVAASLERTVRAALEGGALTEVGVMVLECTIMPQYRRLLQTLTTKPILDVVSVIRRILA